MLKNGNEDSSEFALALLPFRFRFRVSTARVSGDKNLFMRILSISVAGIVSHQSKRPRDNVNAANEKDNQMHQRQFLPPPRHVVPVFMLPMVANT
jgi:hypothetical protein